MTEKIQNALKELHSVLNEELGSNAVACRIFISDHEYNFKVETRSPAQLKSNGISMKNIKGEWIVGENQVGRIKKIANLPLNERNKLLEKAAERFAPEYEKSKVEDNG